ncbi:hypothetical protein NS263_02530 [Curtobacterium oceanosedimentum]|uniref:Uncharacterized protein n=1 Tax=Curtobacterium oceanosedimentum TaxID=465820 RepID=A0ABR5SA45_9MICO|nr:hypothetical protein [Curtobacterium oceanosedimentum]KTR42257.1 hypothetical protein NS263_02530 [Curtobacterium oceanosedimentum]
MPLRDLAMLDEATFDASNVRVTDGCVVLHGSVVDCGTSVGTARLPVTLTVSDAVDVTVDLAGGTGDLVLDRVEVTPTTVTLVGVVPARVVVTTSVQSKALLEVGTTPIAMRRWGRWRPWGTGGPVVLDHRAILKRLRTSTCPECGHPWSEHSTDPDESLTMCSECAYEHDHGETPPGATVCFARVPRALVEPRSAFARTSPSDDPPVDRGAPAAPSTGRLFRPTVSSLREACAALAVGMVSTDEVSALAAELVAAGHDGESLVALASLYSGAATADALDLTRAALVEAGVRPVDLEGEEVPLLALRVACHGFLLGHWTLRAFSSWVHREIGHEGPEAAQQLALVDDELDELDHRHIAVGPSFRRAVERLAVEYIEVTEEVAHPFPF